ncbi:MAG: HAD family phosphatase [Chloroflexota bacterium]|nr:HAD family phosphatase [Chloroflexota bacterium]
MSDDELDRRYYLGHGWSVSGYRGVPFSGVALLAYDIPFTRETFRQTFGMNNTGILQQLLGERFSPALSTEIGELKEERFRVAIEGQVQLLAGVRPLLEELHELGLAQAVGSSAPQANIDAIVDALGLAPYFDVLVSAADMPGKPDPAVFLTAARLLDVKPSRCVVLEDAVAGVTAARRAGMKCIAVTTTNPASTLEEADLIVDRLDELNAARILAL